MQPRPVSTQLLSLLFERDMARKSTKTATPRYRSQGRWGSSTRPTQKQQTQESPIRATSAKVVIIYRNLATKRGCKKGSPLSSAKVFSLFFHKAFHIKCFKELMKLLEESKDVEESRPLQKATAIYNQKDTLKSLYRAMEAAAVTDPEKKITRLATLIGWENQIQYYQRYDVYIQALARKEAANGYRPRFLTVPLFSPSTFSHHYP